MFSISLFQNGKGDTDAVEEISNILELSIDTISSERQALRYRTAEGETITREINPHEISLYIDEGEL